MIDQEVYIHPNALVDAGAMVGSRTRIWAFAHVLSGAVIGKDCNICDHTFIEGDVKIGCRVTIKCGVYIWDGVEIENDVFVGPSVVFTNDRIPRSRQYPDEYPKQILRKGCSIGANATLLPGISIGEWAMVGAGSVVSKDIKPYALVFGNPARFHAWVCCCGEKLAFGSDVSFECRCGKGFQLDRQENTVTRTR